MSQRLTTAKNSRLNCVRGSPESICSEGCHSSRTFEGPRGQEQLVPKQNLTNRSPQKSKSTKKMANLRGTSETIFLASLHVICHSSQR